MADAPLSKPAHLEKGPLPANVWMAQRVAGLAALALGVLAFVVVAVTQTDLWSSTDLRISGPAFAVTAAAAIVSIARRERAVSLWLGGIGLAAAALVLGWVLILGVVVAVAAVLILILHAVM